MEVVNDWEYMVEECIAPCIRSLREKHNSPQIQEATTIFARVQRKFVLIPADKAANNVTLGCKKYYLKVVPNELNTTS